MAIQTVDRFNAVQGETVRLYAQFERNGIVYDPATVNDVTILDPSDTLVATITPNRESKGTYYIDWAVSETRTIGTYTDQWGYYALGGSTLRTNENSFTINTGEWLVRSIRYNWSGFLKSNQVYTVTVSRFITDSNGSALEEDFVYHFTTKYNPLYCNTDEIRLVGGKLLADITDDEINQAIFKASLDAYYLYVHENNSLMPSPIPHVVWAWVRCRAISEILGRKKMDLASEGFGIMKTLGDFTVQKMGTERLSAINSKLEEMKECMQEWTLWEPTLLMSSAVKSIRSAPWPMQYRNEVLRAGANGKKKVHFDPFIRDNGGQYPEDENVF